jgi:hypothetical protein
MFLPVEGVQSLDKAVREERAKEVFIALLKRFTDINRRVSHNKGPTYAPAEAAMRQLFQENRIAMVNHGSTEKPRFHLEAK